MPKLKALNVRNAKPQDKSYKLSDGNGLHFHVAKSGTKTWRYRFKIAGKESTFTLGKYPQMSLTDARDARMTASNLVKKGKNPAQLRRNDRKKTINNELATNEAKKNTFKMIALEWIGQQKERWSKRHTEAVLATLRANAFPEIGEHQIDTITPPLVLTVIRKIEKRGSLEIARKVLQRMNAVFRYSVQTGRATYNPAADMQGVLKNKKVVHRAAISRDDLPQFLKDLSLGDIHITTKLALQFLIATAARTGEVRGAAWDEINLIENIWKIPADRMKMNEQHIVPLSTHAVAIL